MRSAVGSRDLGSRLVAAFGIALSLVGFFVTRAFESQRIELEFDQVAGDRVNLIHLELEGHRQILESIQSLWAASNEVEPWEFKAFVTPLLDSRPGTEQLVWIPAVRGPERAEFERNATRRIGTSFRIWDRGARGERGAAAPRSIHFPVLYLEPSRDPVEERGYDFAADPGRSRMLTVARDSGEVTTSDPVSSVGPSASSSMFLMAIPVYQHGERPSTVDERRRLLEGFAVATFDLTRIVAHALSTLRVEKADIHILDAGGPPGRTILHQQPSRSRPEKWVPPGERELRAFTGPHYARPLDVGGRRWDVVVTAVPEFISESRGFLPWGLFLVGLLSAAGLANLLSARESRARLVAEANASMAREIAERRSVEKALRHSEETLRRVIQEMPVMLIAFDEAGQVIAWNGECERVTGYTPAEMVRNPGASDRLPRDWFRAGCGRDREWEIGARDGSRRTVIWSDISEAFPVPGWARWGVGIDLTARNRAEADRAALQAQILQAQKLESLGFLAGGIAHDFNNLLTGILGNTSLAQVTLPPSSPAIPLLGQAVLAAERAAELTRQMLAYAGKGGLDVRPIDLCVRVREFAHLLTASIPKKVKLDMLLPPMGLFVLADSAQIQQLVMNLVLNAAESCQDRTGCVTLEVRMQEVDEATARRMVAALVVEPGTHVVLEVRDDGCGMDDTTLARIFDPFFTTKFTGRGLGLAAVLGILRAHGGGLTVESSPGRGSTFTVFLPPAGVPRLTEAKPEDPDLRGVGRVLVVDDERVVRWVARAVLERFGYEVLEANDGREAVERFRDRGGEIDLVLLDRSMPEMSGEEVVRELRALRPDVKIVISSGYESAEMDRDVLESVAGFVPKPYTPRALAAEVRRVMGQRESETKRRNLGPSGA